MCFFVYEFFSKCNFSLVKFVIFVMAAPDFNDVILEFFDDNDSDEEFLGYSREQMDAEMAERARQRPQSVQDDESDDSRQSRGRMA